MVTFKTVLVVSRPLKRVYFYAWTLKWLCLLLAFFETLSPLVLQQGAITILVLVCRLAGEKRQGDFVLWSTWPPNLQSTCPFVIMQEKQIIKKRTQQLPNTLLCHISVNYSMWSLCGMQERRQWWWWGRAPGCKVRNSAPGTVLSENLALIGPSSGYHQLPTQICWQVLSVQKQNPMPMASSGPSPEESALTQPAAQKALTRHKLTDSAPLRSEWQQIKGTPPLERSKL